MIPSVDLNCDMGELIAANCGGNADGNDEDLIKYISSANIACGFHAGSPSVMRRTVRLAARHGVAIGRISSLRDPKSFGRQWMDTSPDEAFDIVVYQIAALAALAHAEGASFVHVKPHGALYNRAARDAESGQGHRRGRETSRSAAGAVWTFGERAVARRSGGRTRHCKRGVCRPHVSGRWIADSPRAAGRADH